MNFQIAITNLLGQTMARICGVKDRQMTETTIESLAGHAFYEAGKLLSSTETEDNYGTYTYEYDLIGNCISETSKIGTDKVQLVQIP